MRIGLLGLLCPGLLFCFLVLLLLFLSLLFNAPTRHTKQLNFYIYICILHNYKLILLVAPHTKKDLLKLYLLLNYNISDNRSIGQGKIKTKTNKKNDKSVCWSLLLSKQIRGLSSLLSRASLCQAKEAPGSTRVSHCFSSAYERSQDAGAEQFTSTGTCASAPLPWQSLECSWHLLVPFHLRVGQLESTGVA